MEEQSTTANDMVSNVENLSGIAKDVKGLSKVFMDEVNKLNGIAEELRQVVGEFKTKSGELMILDLVKTDHRIFIQGLGMSLTANKKSMSRKYSITMAAVSANGTSNKARKNGATFQDSRKLINGMP